MEKNLDRAMEQIMENPGVSGCIFADHHGLSLGAKGTVPLEIAGIITAIAEQAAKLESNSKPPTIHLEKDGHSCTIHRVGTVTGAVFKNINN